MTNPVIELQQLCFGWKQNQNLLHIEEFSVAAGERVFLRGPSGSGKTTLLNLITGIHTPVSGKVTLTGTDITGRSGAWRDRFRADHIGLIFQQFNLLPYLSVLDNVLLPCRFSGLRRQKAGERYGTPEAAALALLSELGIGGLLQQPVTDLSIGQQQRVAAARALIGSPEILIADEPTSSLDSDTRSAFIELLISECEQNNTALLFVSHDNQLASHFCRIVGLDEINTAGLLVGGSSGENVGERQA